MARPWPIPQNIARSINARPKLAFAFVRSFVVRGPSRFLLRSILSPLSLSLSLFLRKPARDDTTGRGKKSPVAEKKGGPVSAAGIPTANIRSNNPLGESPHRPLPSASPSGCRCVARVYNNREQRRQETGQRSGNVFLPRRRLANVYDRC